jgi:hypothetical protein
MPSSKDGELLETECINKLHSTQVTTETSETQVEDVSEPKAMAIPTTDLPTGMIAPTKLVKDGSLTEEQFTSQDTQSEMESDSRSKLC